MSRKAIKCGHSFPAVFSGNPFFRGHGCPTNPERFRTGMTNGDEERLPCEFLSLIVNLASEDFVEYADRHRLRFSQIC
jgi:hypothetical protein